MIGIYSITNIMTGQVYIGESTDIEKRWEQHIESLNNNAHHNYKLQQSWNEWGEKAFDFNVVENCNPFNLYIFYDYIKLYLIMREYYYCNLYSKSELYNLENTLDKIQHQKKIVTHYEVSTYKRSNKKQYKSIYTQEKVSTKIYFKILFAIHTTNYDKDFLSISNRTVQKIPILSKYIKDNHNITITENRKRVIINKDEFAHLFGLSSYDDSYIPTL